MMPYHVVMWMEKSHFGQVDILYVLKRMIYYACIFGCDPLIYDVQADAVFSRLRFLPIPAMHSISAVEVPYPADKKKMTAIHCGSPSCYGPHFLPCCCIITISFHRAAVS